VGVLSTVWTSSDASERIERLRTGTRRRGCWVIEGFYDRLGLPEGESRGMFAAASLHLCNRCTEDAEFSYFKRFSYDEDQPQNEPPGVLGTNTLPYELHSPPGESADWYIDDGIGGLGVEVRDVLGYAIPVGCWSRGLLGSHSRHAPIAHATHNGADEKETWTVRPGETWLLTIPHGGGRRSTISWLFWNTPDQGDEPWVLDPSDLRVFAFHLPLLGSPDLDEDAIPPLALKRRCTEAGLGDYREPCDYSREPPVRYEISCDAGRGDDLEVRLESPLPEYWFSGDSR
jgi:hypothetical protein